MIAHDLLTLISVSSLVPLTRGKDPENFLNFQRYFLFQNDILQCVCCFSCLINLYQNLEEYFCQCLDFRRDHGNVIRSFLRSTE